MAHKKPNDFYEKQGEILRNTFVDKRIRISVRNVMNALGYKSPAAAANAIHNMIRLNIVEYDEEKKAYFLR